MSAVAIPASAVLYRVHVPRRRPRSAEQTEGAAVEVDVEAVPAVDGSGVRFERLFRELHPGLFGLTYRLVGDAGDTEDVVQEAFARLSRDPVLARPDDEVRAWLRRVALNLGANHLRGRRRARARLERVGRLEAVDGRASRADHRDGGPLDAVLRAEQRAAVRAALLQLPERQRDCLLLRHSGYSYAEIAATVGIAVGSVGVLLARAERRFRDHYQED